MKKKLFTGVAVGAIGLGAALVVPGVASATLTGCSTGYGTRTAWSECTSGTGQQRVRVICEDHDPNIVLSAVRYGPWQGQDQLSSRFCGESGGYLLYVRPGSVSIEKSG